MLRPIVLTCCLWPSLAATGLYAAEPLTDTDKERFLRQARIVGRQALPVGVTGSRRATLSDGELRHDAHIQTVDRSYRRYQRRTDRWVRLRDSYSFNIAAYKLDRLLGLGMVPVSVERAVDGRPAAVTWWVDDVAMMESDRVARAIEPPDAAGWRHQMEQAELFNQLLFNTDRNPSNLLITADWRLWMVDFTRAFRAYRRLPEPGEIGRVDRRLHRGLEALDRRTLRRETDGYLSWPEVDAVMARREELLDLLGRRVTEHGEAAVICDLPGH